MDSCNINDIFIGIDGGATKTRGVLFNGAGKTLASSLERGSNLTVYKDKAVQRICRVVQNLLRTSKVDLGSVKCIGLGIAGSSDKDMRDLLFRELDKYNISEKDLIELLDENKIESSGIHVQAGLQFKVLLLDSFLFLEILSKKPFAKLIGSYKKGIIFGPKSDFI